MSLLSPVNVVSLSPIVTSAHTNDKSALCKMLPEAPKEPAKASDWEAAGCHESGEASALTSAPQQRAADPFRPLQSPPPFSRSQRANHGCWRHGFYVKELNVSEPPVEAAGTRRLGRRNNTAFVARGGGRGAQRSQPPHSTPASCRDGRRRRRRLIVIVSFRCCFQLKSMRLFRRSPNSRANGGIGRDRSSQRSRRA